MAYTTIAELKSYLGLTDSEDDTLLSSLITHAERMVEDKTNKVFEAEYDTTRKFDPTRDVDGRTLRFDKPIASITSVTNGDGAAVAAANYVTEPRNIAPYWGITLKASSGLYWTYVDDPENAISVTGRWAYSISAPASVQYATLRLAAWLYKQGESYTPALDRPMMSPDGVLLLPMEMPRDVLALLRPYMEHI